MSDFISDKIIPGKLSIMIFLISLVIFGSPGPAICREGGNVSPASKRFDLSSLPVNDILAYCFDGENGIILAELYDGHYVIENFVFVTIDGGKTWKMTKILDSGKISEIWFYDRDHFWIITQWTIEGTYPTLYRTNNFGRTFDRISGFYNRIIKSSPIVYAENITFESLENGWMKLKYYNDENPDRDVEIILETEDGGTNWHKASGQVTPSQKSNTFDFENANLWKVKKTETKFLIIEKEQSVCCLKSTNRVCG